MSPDIVVGYWPAWLALAVSALLAINRLIEESRKFAGHFGEWGRRRHERAVKRHQIDLHASQFAGAVEKAVADARRKWEQEENEAIAALDARLEAVSKVTGQQRVDLDTVRKQLDIVGEYAEYEAAWHRYMRALAAQQGDVDCVPLNKVPTHMTWWAFEALHKQHGGGRDWWGIPDVA
ncbi:hypothetical protein ACQI4L_08985 [Mycolicibacterium litorale]|uniref:hypothetical protein n=1 Tax=Mycolicibacterium litorale TaxID=758802 RepID=UPI003CEA965C